jgi:hypothetical protein
MVSTDAVNWTNTYPANHGSLWQLAAGPTGLIGVGGDYPVAGGRFITTSGDGNLWNFQGGGAPANGNFYGVSFGNGAYVAVGGYFDSYFGRNRFITTSLDGAYWQAIVASNTPALYGVTYGNGSFVTVGALGTILQSGPISTLSISPAASNRIPQITLTGEADRIYSIEASTNPVSGAWLPMCSVTNGGGVTVVPVTNSVSDQQYFRAVTSSPGQ